MARLVSAWAAGVAVDQRVRQIDREPIVSVSRRAAIEETGHKDSAPGYLIVRRLVSFQSAQQQVQMVVRGAARLEECIELFFTYVGIVRGIGKTRRRQANA